MHLDGLAAALSQSLAYLQTLPDDRVLTYGADAYPARQIISGLQDFLALIRQHPTPSRLAKFINTRCRVYRNRQTVLFTGYYEPLIPGSLQSSAQYRVPIYRKPDDLITIDLSLFDLDTKKKRITGRLRGNAVVPYPDRRQISTGALGRQPDDILAWVADPVDLFFLQIQGSGKILLDDGSWLNLHYHATNGHPYRSIGKLLIDENKIPRQEMSMQRLRRYMAEHPEETARILHHNPSYVFFKIEPDGPRGCLNVPLTAGRSIATDRKRYPPAALAYIITQKPEIDGNGAIVNWGQCRRFVLNQDTGGAINGSARADLFWGNGRYAEIAAGHMQHRGQLFFIVPLPQAPLLSLNS